MLELTGDFMKTNHLQNMVAIIAAAGLTLSGVTAVAQGSSAENIVQPAAVSVAVPKLAYGVPQILKLVRFICSRSYCFCF